MISLKDVWPASHVKVTDLKSGKVTDAGAIVEGTKLNLPKIKVTTVDDLNKGMIQISEPPQKYKVKICSDNTVPKYVLAGIDFSDTFKQLDNLIVSAKPQPPADQFWASAK